MAATTNLTVFDLRDFSDRLPSNAGKLKKAIRQWVDGHSASADLTIATDYIDDAIRIHRGRRTSLVNAATALLHSAIILYARSLERKSDHRGFVRIIEKLGDEGKEFHNGLIQIRDNALAHFGPAGSGRSWNEDHVVLIMEDDVWQPAIAVRRSLFDLSYAIDFRLHLREVCGIVQRTVDERRNAFQSLFDRAIEDAEICAVLKASQVDPKKFGEAGKLIFKGPRSGRAIGIFND